MKIKICGIRNEVEKKVVKGLEVDYLGYVFSKSKRRITFDEYKDISNKEYKSVGVFRNEDINFVIRGIKQCKFDIIQLHGDEDLEFIYRVREEGLKINGKFKIFKGVSLENYNDYKDCEIDKFILDGIEPGRGRIIDLKKVITEFDKEFLEKKVILAGGLSPLNIKYVLENVKVYGVDISTGVETLGLKDREKIKLFVRMVREYEK